MLEDLRRSLSKPGNPFDMKKMHPGKTGSFGIKLSKEKSRYENTTHFNGYPAKRPFYPFTSNLYQEVLPAASAGSSASMRNRWP